MIFTNLTYTKNVDDFIMKTYLKNTNFKYEKNLSKSQINTIEEICSEEMEEVGYKG